VFGAFLLVGQQLAFQPQIRRRVGTPGPGARDRTRGGQAGLDGNQCLGAGTHQCELLAVALELQQVQIGTGIGLPQFSVDGQGIGVRVDLETLAGYHLEDVAGPDVLLRRLNHLDELFVAALASDHGGRCVGADGDHAAVRFGEPGGHLLDASNGVVPGQRGPL